MSKFKTAESVTEGHPDKLCDLIADSILDETLKLDPDCHVACEVMATKGNIIVAGEISAKKLPQIENIVIDTLFRVGYNAFEYEITNLIHSQSKDIEQAVNGRSPKANGSSIMLGAGDQGIVYGYAENETSEYLPLPVELAHKLTNRLTECYQSGEIPYLKPDGKSQVTVEYDVYDMPIRVTSIIISAQHEDGIPRAKILYDIISKVIIPSIPIWLIDHKTKSLINPSGRFVEGGPSADTGLTGRKLMVDSYGGIAHFGGGAFSGKDPTKVDRSGAYFARYVAKNIVASGLAGKCEVAVSYAIGKAEPTSVSVDTFGSGAICDNCILQIIRKLFDFRPSAIITKLDLKQPIYSQTTVGGHFGKENLSWEKLDMVESILEELINYVNTNN